MFILTTLRNGASVGNPPECFMFAENISKLSAVDGFFKKGKPLSS